MPVNGLLLTLTGAPHLADRACEQVAARSGVELGERSGIYQPLAVETADVQAAHEFHEWLESLDGVGQVDVIYVGFDESNEIQP